MCPGRAAGTTSAERRMRELLEGHGYSVITTGYRRPGTRPDRAFRPQMTRSASVTKSAGDAGVGETCLDYCRSPATDTVPSTLVRRPRPELDPRRRVRERDAGTAGSDELPYAAVRESRRSGERSDPVSRLLQVGAIGSAIGTVVARGWWLLISAAICGAVVAVGASIAESNVYRGRADVTIARTTIFYAFVGLDDQAAYAARDPAIVARDQRVLRRALATVGLPRGRSSSLLAVLICSDESGGDSSTIRFTVDRREPALAARLATAYARAFARESWALDVADCASSSRGERPRLASAGYSKQEGSIKGHPGVRCSTNSRCSGACPVRRPPRLRLPKPWLGSGPGPFAAHSSLER